MSTIKTKSSSIYARMTKDNFFRLGYLHQASGNLHAAADYYVQSIANAPNAEAHTFLGWVLGLMGEIDGAISECKKAIKLDPEFGNAWNDIGGYLIQKCEFDHALPYLKKACKAKNYDNPEYPHYNLARVYIHKGMLLQARKELQLSLESNPKFLPAKNALQKLEYQIH
jgi:Tfp pilus assembly protein PilF